MTIVNIIYAYAMIVEEQDKILIMIEKHMYCGVTMTTNEMD